MNCFYRYILPLFVLSFSVLNASSEVARTNSAVVARLGGAPDLAFPVTVSTNAQGLVEHHFSMKPVITNMVAATNDLAQLKAQQDELEAALKKVTEEGGDLKKTIRSDYLGIVGVMTNFAARNEDAKKLQERIQTLEAELKGLKQEFQKKLEEDDAYKLARSRVETDRDAMKKFEEKMAELRKQRTEIGSKVWQLQTMVSQTLKAEEDARANEEKARQNKTESTP